KTKYTIPKIIQEGEREQLAIKLTMAISESGTTDYGTQELQSLISLCLKNYIQGEKERLDLLVPKESGPLKKSTSEDKTISPTKKVELQNKVTQEMETETHKTKPSNPSVDSKSVQTPKEEDPIQHGVNYYNQRLIWEEKTAEKEGSFKQQDFKFRSGVVGNNIRHGKERQEVSGESNMIIRAESSRTKEKNKEKRYTEGERKKKTKIYLKGKVEKLCSRYIEELKASLVQEIISQIEQEENLPHSTNQKLDNNNDSDNNGSDNNDSDDNGSNNNDSNDNGSDNNDSNSSSSDNNDSDDSADKFPTSLTTTKSSLGKSTSMQMCIYVEYPNHRSESQRSAYNEPLAKIIKTNKGTLLRALKLYLVGSIKQQLYIMYQWPGFEEMLR
ncbi:518_t:CDS:2, partial [Gigaspora rosea]